MTDDAERAGVADNDESRAAAEEAEEKAETIDPAPGAPMQRDENR